MKLRYFLIPILLVIGLLLSACSHTDAPAKDHDDVAYYTCAMHPSYRSQDPKAKCPNCGMDLIAVKKQAANIETNSASNDHASDTNMAMHPTDFSIPVARQQLIGVTYATVEKKPLQSTLRAVGTVTYDKKRHWDYVSRFDGYIQKLEVSSPGDLVEKGQPLLTIYSPDLLTTEREFLNLLRMRDEAEKSHSESALQSAQSLLESSKRRLLLWNITTNQIAELEASRQAADTLTLYSPFKGVVQNLQVDQGRRVSMGDHLVDLADLSVVWVWAQFYQDELPLLKTGQGVTIISDSYPDKKISGKITLIDPFINDASRTIRVRIDVENPDFKLRPDMYVNVTLESDIDETLAIPATAVLPTGERNVVFVDKGDGKLEPRFIELGRKYGDYYAIKSGLVQGERVVNSANFLVDAESKVQGALKSW
ncbi:MAG: Efflux transporter, family, subunit [Pedosphaera sp.]|nr:Efflux transporter, family, subunit [Pedosphaera sp.]